MPAALKLPKVTAYRFLLILDSALFSPAFSKSIGVTGPNGDGSGSAQSFFVKASQTVSWDKG